MDWVKTIEAAIEYIENNLTGDLSAAKIAREMNISPFYFQKGFSMLCGYTIGEYIRMRQLSLEGGTVMEYRITGAGFIQKQKPLWENMESALMRKWLEISSGI